MFIPVNMLPEELNEENLQDFIKKLYSFNESVAEKASIDSRTQAGDVVLPPTQPQQPTVKLAPGKAPVGEEHAFVWGFFPFTYADQIYAEGNTVYFHAEIYKESVNNLKKLILEITPEVIKNYWNVGVYNTSDMKLKLYIQSGGGCVDAGFNLIDFITNYPIPIVTIGTGTVASMASLVVMAGKKRKVTKHTNMLFHQFRATVAGKRQDILDWLKYLEKLHKQIVDFIVEKSKLSVKEVQEILKSESWFTSEEVVKMGVVDEIAG